MLHQICKSIVPKSRIIIPNAKYKNFVMSESLAQVEKDCEKFCPIPRVPPQKVTIIGAASDVGQITALFLKQQKVIKRLTLYDDEPHKCVLGVATDLAHIDTTTNVEAYQGRLTLGDALKDSDVVLICGGEYMMPPCCCTSDRELFFRNMDRVRAACIACARFCPHAVLAVQTPPVDCNFSLCMHTLKIAGVYDKRRLLGVNAINAMRANQMVCSITGTDPTTKQTPVVCGSGRCTRVPVFSKGKPGNFPQVRKIRGPGVGPCDTHIGQGTGRSFVFPVNSLNSMAQTQISCLTKLVREADEIICKVKSNDEQGHLSIGFSTARFITSIMQGLFEKPSFIDSALVEQGDPQKCYDMPICATPVTIGKDGIVEYAVPKLDENETKLLKESKCDLEDMLNLGRCYAVGDEYYLHCCKICLRPCPSCNPCPTCEPKLRSGKN